MSATFIWKLTFEHKEQLSQICNEVIDLLRKKHNLSPTQCAFVLDTLRGGLQDTMEELFGVEVKEMKDWKNNLKPPFELR